MTTTPAMPEHSVAIKQLTMAANQFDCAAATTNDHKKAAEYLQESREIRASIATLQAQPASKCDGNHGGPRCADPECWNDDPPEQPAEEVSDDELRKAIDALRDPGTVSAFYNGYYTLKPDELRRAILALRPQAVPMTSKVAPKLIGWRSENFLWETDDIDKARNWEPNIGVLPIFEGDPNTKLGSRGTTAGGEKQA